ncbi:hypothetical protein [Alkalicoccus saliphilus]|uniref:Uncharacterized protein n=1 Tax=Alkalicoccus saliphilus TaxID=200989 RepID=A0A2T4U3X8_9BACI|nr:hypothetical protein [Alkalicoccus saliphilus]PTL38107.1 hypothetical protein C6Y45_13000 [Alkalicoccus saliphilus]
MNIFFDNFFSTLLTLTITVAFSVYIVKKIIIKIKIRSNRNNISNVSGENVTINQSNNSEDKENK